MPPASPSRQNTTKKWFRITRFARSDPKSHFCCGGAAWRGCGCGRHGCTTPRVPSLRLLSTSMSKRLRVNTLTQLIFLVDGVAARHKLRATCRIARRKQMHAAARGQRKRMQRLLVNVRHTRSQQREVNTLKTKYKLKPCTKTQRQNKTERRFINADEASRGLHGQAAATVCNGAGTACAPYDHVQIAGPAGM